MYPASRLPALYAGNLTPLLPYRSRREYYVVPTPAGAASAVKADFV